MAVGFPTKANWAAGDILTAAQMDDLAGTVNTIQAPLGFAAGKNKIINGDFGVWQRGTSVTGSTTAFCADRWQAYCNTTGTTFSRQSSGLTGFNYAVRAQRNASGTATNGIGLTTNLETATSIPLAGQSVTLSFYARAGANFSATSNILSPQLYGGTGTDQNIYSGFTGGTTIINTNVTLTTSWQRFTVTGTVGSTVTQLAIILSYQPTGTAGAADYFEITGVQLEAGSTATNFQTATGTIASELDNAERYYERQTATSTAGVYAVGFASSSTTCDFYVKFSTDKRVAISSIDYSLINASDLVNTPPTVTGITIVMAGVSGVWIRVSAASGFVQYRPYFLLNNNNAAGYIGFNAEL